MSPRRVSHWWSWLLPCPEYLTARARHLVVTAGALAGQRPDVGSDTPDGIDADRYFGIVAVAGVKFFDHYIGKHPVVTAAHAAGFAGAPIGAGVVDYVSHAGGHGCSRVLASHLGPVHAQLRCRPDRGRGLA